MPLLLVPLLRVIISLNDKDYPPLTSSYPIHREVGVVLVQVLLEPLAHGGAEGCQPETVKSVYSRQPTLGFVYSDATTFLVLRAQDGPTVAEKPLDRIR